MSTIVVGYVPNPLGDAAIQEAIREARRRAASLLVLNTTRADRLVDPGYADSGDVSKLETVLRHRTPVGKLIMGSTAQHILLAAKCNVLAVKL